MKKLEISSLPLRSVVSDIARELQTDYTKRCGVFQVEIPEAIGSGTISAMDFDDGLGLIRYDCTFVEDMVFEYSVDMVHPLKFLFCIQGQIQHTFMNETIWHKISMHQNAIVASSAHHGHRIQFSAGKHIVYSSLELDRRKFQAKISCEPTSIDKSWRDMLNDITAKKTFYHDGFYSLELSRILNQWDKYQEGDFLKKLFLEGISYKILVLQIEQFQDDIKSEGKKTMLRQSEVKQIAEAVNLIDNQLEDLPTISDIGLTVGLNANKLQQGFKELLGKTVNTYVREKRADTARTLLLSTDQPLSTIASIVGYRSRSYLSKMFRETYGIKPSDFRRKHEVRKVQIENTAQKNRS